MKLGDTSAAVRLTLLMGKGVPLPAPPFVMEAFESAEVARSDVEPSGFSMTFKLGRDASIVGKIPLLATSVTKAGARVVLTGTVGNKPEVLIDGIVEDVDVQPPGESGVGTLTLKGRDLTVMMDREERQATYPGLGPTEIVLQILTRYALYGIVPDVRSPVASTRDNPVERTPSQAGTDLEMVKSLAETNGFIFTLIPGPVPMTTRAYWGPPPRIGGLQPAITVDMGPETNVANLNFELEEGEAANVEGEALDTRTGQSVPVRSFASTRPPLALMPSLSNAMLRQSRLLRPRAGQGPAEAMATAQAQAESTTDTLKATGDLDIGKYGRVLKTSKLVGLRGAGLEHDGLYYVRDVIHKISRGSWIESFTITREGLGSTVPAVLP